MTEATDRNTELDQHISAAQIEQAGAEERLQGALRWITQIDPLYGPQLMSVSDATHTPILTLALPVTATGTTGVEYVDADPVLTEPVPSCRP
jgi:hypothetical protein